MHAVESNDEAAGKQFSVMELHYTQVDLHVQEELTCVHCVGNVLVCGSNVGNAYVFAVENASRGALWKPQCQRIAFGALPSADISPISRVCLCPAKEQLAIGTLRGTLHIAHINATAKKLVFKHHIKDHQIQDAEVTLI